MMRTVMFGTGADLADAFVVEFVQGLAEDDGFHWM